LFLLKHLNIFTIFGISVFAALLMIGVVANQVMAAPLPKVIICHNGSDGPKAIEVSENALKAHLGHGDTLGECVNLCGNGTEDAGEQCDDGNTANGDGCSSTCQNEPRCGDGTVGAGEQCDDGNVTNDDACTNVCRLAACGDGIVQPSNNEDCDDGNLTNGDGCTSICTVEFD
jgi:cysteine-rich repeat protein